MTLTSVLRVLRRLTVIELTGSLVYRTQFVVYMVSTVVSMLVGLLLWLRVSESGADLPVDREFIVSYYIMLAIVRVLVTTWHSEYLAMVIRKGQLNSWLVRPGSYLLNLIANNIAEKIVKIVALSLLMIPIVIFVRDAFVLPANLAQWLLFLLAVAMAAAIQFCLTSAVGSLGFWLEDNSGIARGRHVISMILSGELVPLALYPAWAMGFLDWQPFRFMLSFPIEVLLGSLSTNQLIYGFAMQIVWTGFFGWLCWFTWQRGLRAYNAIGA